MPMELEKLFSDKRTGKSKNYPDPIRSEYQRDIDRLIFSSAFRRLQNKTQVFPLPGSAFVHNRLTHSLEVSTVGRSIAKLVGVAITKKYNIEDNIKECYKFELPNIVAAACLAHDIGNPAFGHSGEKAISNFFVNNEVLKSQFTKPEWKDLTNFEGNANAFRLLTKGFTGKMPGGLKLTYTTLATLLKYPCESTAMDDGFKHRKKFGFFQSEVQIFREMAASLNMIEDTSDPLSYFRHPFVYLLEAADDITYAIIDFEDAHRLGILSNSEIHGAFWDLITCIGRAEDDLKEIERNLSTILNDNERVSYLRSRAINSLILEARDEFMNNVGDILKGNWNESIVSSIKKRCSALVHIADTSDDRIYNHPSVMELELAGYNVMSELLGLFIPAVLESETKRKPMHQKAIRLISPEFGPFTDIQSPYEKCMGVLDFVSGMTDIYATELYRKIKGIEIGKHT